MHLFCTESENNVLDGYNGELR